MRKILVVQEQVIVQEIPDAPQVQVAERKQEQIVEAIHEEIRCGVPAVFQAASPVVENIASAPGVQAPTLVEEIIAPALAVLHSPTPVVECTAPAPAVVHSPTPVVESVAPAPALSEAPAPGVEHISPAPAGLLPVPMVANIAPEPSVSHSPAPVVDSVSPRAGCCAVANASCRVHLTCFCSVSCTSAA